MERFKAPVVLVIRDGWGEREARWDNAITGADTPTHRWLDEHCPRTTIATCGLDVGLPDGVMGNSEVGHQNIGAGRIVDQEIVRIDKAFGDGSLGKNPVILSAIQQLQGRNSALHLLGLCSDGGVHSVLRHLYGFLRLAKRADLKKVYLHFIADGRDTPPFSGIEFAKKIEEQCRQIGIGEIVSLMGRFWAMDRDSRWDRVERAYHFLTTGDTADALHFDSVEKAFQHFYQNPASETMKGDEFIPPCRIGKKSKNHTVEDHDVILFFNFRGDRPRELTSAFVKDDFKGFVRKKRPSVKFLTLTEYEKGLVPDVIFPRPPKMEQILGAYVSQLGLRQLRCAETEKYAHVTFFFNDYREEPFPLEDRILIPSPKDVATYDQKPEMSAKAVCDAVVKALGQTPAYDLVIVNFANPDMVGHTGNLEAAKKAVQVVDACIGRILQALTKVHGRVLITSDHGNAEQMWDEDSRSPHTQHTLNPVTLYMVGEGMTSWKLRSGGRLADMAPTLLELMGLPPPEVMTGQSLIITS
ncbi:MAG: 2,3-bisphosphoglycerate-independent phosphoglycerate mutase [Puniceicoccales bacterium]|jgi:2,3-bisphosphoglycerate-independent phosphoglycerate mutase|nr:2,3-bisphosphoglycerate-independent phosphoglycerate mutase [Puniceicoccales bacterium]